VVRDLSELCERTFSRVSCCEVLEHLSTERQLDALVNIRRLLRQDGIAIISVPIEIGTASLLKNLARLAIGQAHPGTTFVSMFRSFFGLKIRRSEESGFIPSHIGFYYQNLGRLFEAAGLQVVRRRFSPFPWLHRFVNSHVFYVLKVKP
jgi:2-polyprenyl-3-methyl-5-hydroxy-6-metoxy-1,4-benzoquinol methylase